MTGLEGVWRKGCTESGWVERGGAVRATLRASLSGTFGCRKPVPGVWVRAGGCREGVLAACKLQALVYDILPSSTALFSYAIGPRKLSANEQFLFVCFCWCSNSSKFVTNNSNKTRRVIYSLQQSSPQHEQTHTRLNRDETIFYYPGWMRLMVTCALGR